MNPFDFLDSWKPVDTVLAVIGAAVLTMSGLWILRAARRVGHAHAIRKDGSSCDHVPLRLP